MYHTNFQVVYTANIGVDMYFDDVLVAQDLDETDTSFWADTLLILIKNMDDSQ